MFPNGERFNYFFQKHVSRTLPKDDERFLRGMMVAAEHYENFTKYSPLAGSEDCVSYEFGAGWDLVSPISLSLLGIKRLYCVDIRELAFPDLLNDTISKIHRLRRQAPFEYSLPQSRPVIDTRNARSVLKGSFGIDYMAPLDARDTGFPESTVSLVVSDLTFEHIPEDDIASILRECFRIMKKGAVLSCRIDYKDHWSYFDKSLSVYNFLKYSPQRWRRYNPSLHYQNRLRHRDYLDIIAGIPFEILEIIPAQASDDDLRALESLEIDPHFRQKYTLDELAVTGSHIILRK